MLELVTITGADDQTSIDEIAKISKEYPWVEWGILVSRRQEGTARFPSRKWVSDFAVRARDERWNVSTHVCGEWVRRMFTGTLDWMELPDVIQITRRIQINTHAEEHVSTVGLIRSLGEAVSVNVNPDLQFIFQWDGVNNHLTYAAQAYSFNVCALFDTSGGAGVLPGSWPHPDRNFWCGYAGGLGPENIAEQLPLIEKAATWPGTNTPSKDYWIDMERRVRTDHEVLDMSKVRAVLEICKQHRANTIGKVIKEELNRG